MTTYLISFGEHAMDHIPAQDMPAVAEAAHAVARDALNAGVLPGTGLLENQQAGIVATDGTVTDGPCAETIAGVTVVDGALTRGGAGVGGQDRRRLPLRARGPGIHARPRPRAQPGAPPRRRDGA